jgi:hypothetical protein
MGDREFEDFLDGKEGEQLPTCQKRLLFEIIQQKMDSSIDLIDTLSKLYLKAPKSDYTDWIDSLMIISKESFEQLDYLMSVLLDEIDPDEDDVIDKGL